MLHWGDYIFIEEDIRIVTLADWFKTLPVKYEYLKKTHSIQGVASKQNVLIGANMDPRLTIVLMKKVKPVKKP